MRKSKGWLILNAGFVLAMSFMCGRFPGGDLFSQAFLWVGLIFAAWAAVKFYADYRRAKVGLTYRLTTPEYDEPPSSSNRGFGIFDPNDL